MKVLSPTLDLQSKQIDNVLDPTSAQDAATKSYVDTQDAGTLSKTDDTNVTLTLSGTPIGALWKSVGLALGWTGALATSRGGVAAGGTAAQKYLKNSGTNYDGVWSTLLASQFNPTNPTATTLTAGAMMGLGRQTTPVTFTLVAPTTGKVLLMISGYANCVVANSYAQIAFRYGTGTAPLNGAAPVGTAWGPGFIFTPPFANASGAFCAQAILSGLVAATAYWVDIVLASQTAGNSVALGSLSCSFMEL